MQRSYGRNQNRPRSRVTVDYSALGAAQRSNEKHVLFLGSAHGGVPGQVYEFSSYSQARSVLRGGGLLDALEMAWNPSPTSPGASRIFVIRVEDAEPATLQDGAITLTSRLYGADANDIQVSYEDNTITNTKRFSVVFTRDRYERVYDNIGNIFSIQYEGEEEQATISINQSSTTNLSNSLVLKVGESDDMTTIRTYPLGAGSYEDVNVLINDINNLPDFTAEMFVYGDKNIKSNLLDAVADQDIKDSAHTVTAVAGDLAQMVANDPFVEMEIDRGQDLPEEIELQNLQGASDGTVPASWADFLPSIVDTSAYYIVPLSDKSSIHAEVSQFLRDLSDTASDHRRAFVGGARGETIEQILSRQASLRNPRVVLSGTSGTYIMGDGRELKFAPYQFCAILAGIGSGQPVGEPLTFKRVAIENLETNFSGDQLDQFDARGVMAVEYVRNRTESNFRIVSDVTTYNSKTEPVDNKMSLGELTDTLTTELRTLLETRFLGTRVLSTSANIIKIQLTTFLDEMVKSGIIVEYSESDLLVSINENTVEVQLAVVPSVGIDYINAYVTYKPAILENDN